MLKSEKFRSAFPRATLLLDLAYEEGVNVFFTENVLNEKIGMALTRMSTEPACNCYPVMKARAIIWLDSELLYGRKAAPRSSGAQALTADALMTKRVWNTLGVLFDGVYPKTLSNVRREFRSC